ncbi:unnamed protein product [Adineta steineri]|uniref:Uncharacterized protein n=1 Tax=Adineta steineri TaxID=433720 RepID=A0A814G2F2_9BILA|nr:unnamed protein product [Adineta steineri]CAF4150903.1 unnamed protein product [Adineta steineri]
MIPFNFAVYFLNQFHTFFISSNLSYNELVQLIKKTFRGSLKDFILQIYDNRFKIYVEFDDEYINWLRNRLPRTSIETIFGRIISKRPATQRAQHPPISLSPLSSDRMKQHVIWLDNYIGRQENCPLLKLQFCKATSIHDYDINTVSFTGMIEPLICLDTIPDPVSRNTTQIYCFNVFQDIERCLNFMKKVEPHSITILITSNDFGSHIVPLLAHLTHVFVYILQNDWYWFEWGFDYLDRLQMFDHHQTLLIRIIRDLAFSYVQKAELCQKSQCNQSLVIDALKYLQWARLLYERADRIDGTRFSSERIEYINNQIDKYEQIIDDSILDLDPDFGSISKETI